MAILHKNISAEGDIHNPKWFSGANNGDVAWRNELGVLESTDELVLPAALNFVDGSAAPPTSNSGDIYVLSSGASVNAGWGTVALGDWVRYDGTTWNLITPQKSTLCYNETTDALNSYDGSTWSAIGGGGGGGGNTIYTANDTIGTGRVATLTDTLRFKSGIVEIEGIGTSGSSALAIYDGQGTPVKLWDFLDNGNVNLGVDSTINKSTNKISVSGVNVSNYGIFAIESTNQGLCSVGYRDSTNGYFGFTGYRATSNYITIGSSNSLGVAIEGSSNSQDYKFTSTEFTCEKNIVLNGTQEINGNWISSKGNLNVNTSNSSFSGLGLTDDTNGYMGFFGYRPTNDFFVIESTNAISGISFNTNGNNRRMTITDNGVNISNLPTSATGLSSGDLWNDGGTLKIA